MKPTSLVKNLSVTLVATILTGCATSMTSDHFVNSTYESDISLKTIRAIAYGDEWEPGYSFSKALSSSPGPGWLVRKSWNDKAKTYRWISTETKTGPVHYSGYFNPSFTLIPDQIPKLEKGDIIDVLYSKEHFVRDFDNLQADIVVRLVCKHNDKECLSKIKKSNKWNALFGYEVPVADMSQFTYTPVR